MTAASENLLTTYFALGSALPGAEIRETDGFVALLSDLPHASGNFAARLRLDPWSAGALRTLAEERPGFQAIALPDDGPGHLAELLRRAGFEPVHRLVAMTAYPTFGLTGLEMSESREEDERRRVGRFMADLFFAREPVLIREAMAHAMAASPLAIHAHFVRERPLAAVALTRTASTLGIYNLGVAAPNRGGGMGSSLVAWCLAQAAAETRMACLQCDPALEPWYARHGFARAGMATVWSARSPR